MSTESRRVAGVLLIIKPTVVFGGVSVLTLLVNDPTYQDNALRQDLWRAGHAHGGVLLVLSLIALRYVDETRLGGQARWFVRYAVSAAAILLPIAFYLSVLSPEATEPNALMYLAYLGAVSLVAGLLTLGVGLLRPRADSRGSRGIGRFGPRVARGVNGDRGEAVRIIASPASCQRGSAMVQWCGAGAVPDPRGRRRAG